MTSEDGGRGPKDGEKTVSTNGASQRLPTFLDPNQSYFGPNGWDGVAKAPVRQPRLASTDALYRTGSGLVGSVASAFSMSSSSISPVGGAVDAFRALLSLTVRPPRLLFRIALRSAVSCLHSRKTSGSPTRSETKPTRSEIRNLKNLGI